MKKEFLFFALAGLFSVSSIAQNEVKFYTFDDEGVYFFGQFSSNGRYILGNTTSMGVYYDRLENKLVTMYDLASSDYPKSEARGINNDATIICGGSIFTGELGDFYAPTVFNLKDGVWTPTALPLEKNTGSDTYCDAVAMSGDGRYIVGDTPANDVYIRACVWKDRELEVLPITERSGYVDIARSVSDDGKLIGGVVADPMYGFPVVWEEGKLIDLSDNFSYSGGVDYVSRNGKYGCFNRGEAEDKAGNYMPFIWNRETREITPVQVHEGASGGVANAISEDGKIIAGYSMYDGDVTMRKPFIIINGEFNDLDEYMKTLGWEVPDEYKDNTYEFSFFTVIGMSPTGTALCGMADVGHRLGWIIEFEEYNSSESVESVSQSSLSVYPNPVKDRLYIQGDCLSATVYNQAGVAVLSSNSVMEYLDMSNLAKGIYYVKLVGEKETATKKIIVE